MQPPSDIEEDAPRLSLDADLGRRLSQLSSSAKFAVTLNQISRVAIRAAYEREEHGRAVTVYVVDVFLRSVQKGLPKPLHESERARKRHLKHEQQQEQPDHHVEHRYSEFRLLRRRVEQIVSDPDSDHHPQWCAYCSRVMWLVTAGEFPSRYPNRGLVATCTGWRQLIVFARKHGLEHFINELLTAAKDVSYRYSAVQCERYARVSHLLNDFLAEESGGSDALSWC